MIRGVDKIWLANPIHIFYSPSLLQTGRIVLQDTTGNLRDNDPVKELYVGGKDLSWVVILSKTMPLRVLSC